MSFGVVQTMITTLKNNEKMRSKRDKFKRPLKSRYPKTKPEYNFPKATPEMLRSIRERLIKENKIRMTKVIILTIILFSALIVLIVADF